MKVDIAAQKSTVTTVPGSDFSPWLVLRDEWTIFKQHFLTHHKFENFLGFSEDNELGGYYGKDPQKERFAGLTGSTVMTNIVFGFKKIFMDALNVQLLIQKQ